MLKLSAAFKEDCSPERSEIYYQYLSDFSIETLSVAVDMALTGCKWFPKIAEIREYAQTHLKSSPSPESSLLQLEHKEEFISPERAKDLFREIQERLAAVESRPVFIPADAKLQGDAAADFEKKRARLRAQVKKVRP
jgi:hypothetical protein